MGTKIFICLSIVITPALCDSIFYEYSEYCKPPFNDTTLVPTTTPGPGVTGAIPYPFLQPIERCCPQCEKCKHLGGTCHLKWALDLYEDCVCDYKPVHPCRDYSCQCCIICQDDKCSDCTESGGHCRKECRSWETEDKWANCSYPASKDGGEGCKCCKKCELTSECIDYHGICATHAADCPWGTYASSGCCGSSSCVCCKPVPTPVPGTRCDLTPGAICLPAGDEDCPEGFYPCLECASTLYTYGLSRTVSSYCCIPKNAAAKLGGPGRLAGKVHHKIGTKIHHNIREKVDHSIENLEAEQANRIHAQNQRHPRQFMD